MQQLTIIIPFLNEGTEIGNTILSIRETCVGHPYILLINDASTDGYNYLSVAQQHGCQYIHHQERKGIAASRNEGVKECTTPYFLFLDGHMRFFEKGWDEKVIALLQANPRSLLCGQTRKLEKGTNGEVIHKPHQVCYGAYVDMSSQVSFKAAWNYTDILPFTNLMETPCILGAAYACHKDYWEHLHGLDGLQYYGMDEELISIKIWCEGGRCLLVKDWEVGHIYRDAFPYAVPSTELIYNRLLVIELFIPYALKRELFLKLQHFYGQRFEQAFEMLKKQYSEVKKQKRYLHSIFERDIGFFLEKNQKISELYTIAS